VENQVHYAHNSVQGNIEIVPHKTDSH